MLLEKDNIQYRGFHNIYDEQGNAIGFEIRFRMHYYRGLWLSQIRVGRVIVDGEEFLADSGLMTWIIDGNEYTPAQMKQDNKHFWEMQKPAIIRIKKPGGLSQGYHDVAVRYSFSSSYMPPELEVFDDSVEGRAMMGSNTFKKRMLIV